MTDPPSPGEAYRLGVTVTCGRCEQRIDGLLMFGERNELVDSRGFMVFADSLAVCDSCLSAEDNRSEG